MSFLNNKYLQDELEDGFKEKEENAEFIKEHISIVEAISAGLVSRGKLPTGVVYDDMVSWGIEGLLKARKKFNADKGASFKTYANFRVRGEILDNLRKEWGFRFPSSFKSYQDKIQERIADVLDETIRSTKPGESKKVTDLLSTSAMVYILSSDELGDSYLSEVEDSLDMENSVESAEDKSILWDEVEGLDEEEQLIIKMFYKQNMTQKVISEKLNLSRSKICRLHEQVLQKLKRRVERRYLD